MTQDDVIEMASKAGLAFDSDEYPEIWQTYMNVGKQEIKAFADLVAAKATEEANARANASWTLMCKKMVDIEREEIAKWIEDAPPLVDFAHNGQGGCLMCGFTPKIAAASIRARKETV